MERSGRFAGAIALAVFMLALTLVAGVLGIRITTAPLSTAAWWPAAGTGLLTLILFPRRWWPTLGLALTLTYFLANIIGGHPLGSSVGLALSDITETLLVAGAIDRRIGRRLSTIGDFGQLLVISFVGALVGALGVSMTSFALLGGAFWQTLLNTTIAHGTSLLLIAPLGLIARERRYPRRSTLVVQVVLLGAATLSAFGRDQTLSLGYAPIPFLIWAGLALGVRVVAIEQVAIAITVTTMTVAGWGTFAVPSHRDSLVVQLYLVCLILSGLPLALAVRGQRTAIAATETERRRTAAVIDSSTTPILVTDPHGRLVFINPATTLLTGFTEEELVGRPFWEKLLSPEAWRDLQERYGGDEPFPERGEGVIRTASGGERMVTYSTGVLPNPGDGSDYLVITINDVTTERATSHLLQHLLRSETTVAILGTDTNGRITLVNAGAEAILRVRVDDATERTFVEFLDPAELAERGFQYGALEGFPALVHEVETDGVSRTGDWTWVPPDGVPLRVSMTTSLIADGAGRPIGFLFVARDVTETRRNQEILREALAREETAVDHLRALDEAKDDFVSTVSHELRTPLSSIIGSTELLVEEMVGDLTTDQRQLLAIIGRNSERLLALANDLLLLAAHKNATVTTQFGLVDLRDVARASHASVTPLLLPRDLALHQDLPDSPVPVIGDPDYLERAVTNLLTNAIKFTPDGGTVTTTARIDPDGATCSLSVSDTGIGIPPDELRDVFVRFFRSSNVRADAIQGTGLGLAIVRSIVESHDGRIEVESEPGEGTTFTITLPRGPSESGAWIRPD